MEEENKIEEPIVKNHNDNGDIPLSNGNKL